MNHKKMVIQQQELPLPIEIQGKNGEREIYMLNPAGRNKFGACLNKVIDPLRQVYLTARNYRIIERDGL